MTVALLRAVTIAMALSCGMLHGTAGRAAEQDTSNGVAPAKEMAAAPAGDHKAAEPAHTEAAAAPVPAPAGTAAPAATLPAATPPTDAQRYCQNIATVAAEARFAWQTKKLTELQAQVTERIGDLEKKQAELEAILNKREDAMKRAKATLIPIYAKMAPDAAAAQLSLLDDETAAAVLAQLSPRQSSAILNEIKPERASQLVGTMTSLPSATDKADGKKS